MMSRQMVKVGPSPAETSERRGMGARVGAASAENWVLAVQRSAGNHAAATLFCHHSERVVQRAPAPSGADPVRDVVNPTVSIARALLARAEELACGTPAELEGAGAILRGLADWLAEDASPNRRAEAFRSLGFAKQTAMMATGHSIDAISGLQRRLALERRYNPSGPMPRTMWQYHRREFDIGGEFLEVLTGERTLSETVAPAIEQGAMVTIEIGVGSLPVAGALVAIGEALIGRNLSGRKMSRIERALVGGLGVLSEIGLLVRGIRAATTAARLRILARAEVALLRNLGYTQAVVLVAGVRTLTSSERRLLRVLAQTVRRGGTLTAEQIAEANRLLSKMDEGAFIASALERNKQQLGTATGLIVEAGARPSVHERRVADALMQHFGSDRILALADRGAAPGAAPGLQSADFLVNRTLVDTYAPTTRSLNTLIKEIGKKQSQAGVVALDLVHGGFERAQAVSEITRALWGNPRYAGISRVLIVEGRQVTADLARPATFTVGEGAVAAGAAARTGARAADEETQKRTQ
jgi:hypothetical protein